LGRGKDMNKAIIISAPSGAGKTTVVKHLLSVIPSLEFSISACCRPKREGETDGKDYYFMSAGEFKKKIENDEFVEWQEVYPGNYYGTLKSELQRIWEKGSFPIFDVDVIGGLNLKKYFGEKAIAICIRPPSLAVLKERLQKRGTETEESFWKRLGKAKEELTFSEKFDRTIVNDQIEKACEETFGIVNDFLYFKDNLPQ
jgi:guanylate kinase